MNKKSKKPRLGNLVDSMYAKPSQKKPYFEDQEMPETVDSVLKPKRKPTNRLK